jgi:hypothetical protein
MNLPMIRSWQGANEHNPHESALVKVPALWVGAVSSLVQILREHPKTGLLVTNVGPHSLAGKAGIARGDLLLRYGGVELHKSSTLRRLAEKTEASHIGTKRKKAGGGRKNGQVVIEALRSGKEMRFKVQKGPLGITVSALFRHLIPARHQQEPKKQESE